MRKKFENVLLDLVEGKLSPEQWKAWWDEHDENMFALLKAGEYPLLKPKKHGFYWVPILTSQKEAIRYLECNHIPFNYSALYQQNYEKELNEYCQQQDVIIKEKLNKLKAIHPKLFEKYPRFCKSLKNAYSIGDEIQNGIADMLLNDFVLPKDIKAFFEVVSVINLDGISIDYSGLRKERLCKKEYIVLGEFCKEADGDLVLIKLENEMLPTHIYYYCHSTNKVKKLCNSIDELMENKFSYHNNG